MVTYLTAGANKTSFARFNVEEWQAKMLTQLHNLRSAVPQAADAIIALVNILKSELEYQDVVGLQPDIAAQGETYLFDGRYLHWGNASEDLRFVVYSQAVSRYVLEKWHNDEALQLTVLTTYYSAEYVVDRRTIASPTFLYNLWLYAGVEQSKKIAEEAREMWEKLSDVATDPRWPSAVCQCCVRNDVANLIRCTDVDCWMGAAHLDCMPHGSRRSRWKCSGCGR